MSDLAWPMPPPQLQLSPDAVHVWRAPLDLPGEDREALRGVLGPDEVEHARRYVGPERRVHFVAARGVLRSILGGYLGIAPREVPLTAGRNGKPELAGAAGRAGVHFNVAHSHGLALYAVALRRETGVDLEHVRADVEVEAIAGRCLSPREFAAWQAVPVPRRTAAFFQWWTRKEAYLKARGDGLVDRLDLVDVFPLVGDPSEGSCRPAQGDGSPPWSLADVRVHPAYAAALVVEGHGWHVARWQWPATHRLR